MADKKDRSEITMLLMPQADIEIRFYGTIHRGQDSDGTPVIPDWITVK
jgi:hypothetical protein